MSQPDELDEVSAAVVRAQDTADEALSKAQEAEYVGEAVLLIRGILDDLVRAIRALGVDASQHDADLDRLDQLGRLWP